MATFPSGLPAPSYDSYALSPIDQTIRTDMEVGAAKSRRRTVTRQDKVTVSWSFTDAQMTTFRDWFDNASTGANGGAGWFTISLMVGSTGFVTKTARFVGAFQSRLIPVNRWQVSGSLEIA